jgi:hypothetical protein
MNLAIWPIFGHPTLYGLSSVLVASGIEKRVLLAFVEAGMKVTCPSDHILEIIRMTEVHYTPLTPEMAHAPLLY